MQINSKIKNWLLIINLTLIFGVSWLSARTIFAQACNGKIWCCEEVVTKECAISGNQCFLDVGESCSITNPDDICTTTTSCIESDPVGYLCGPIGNISCAAVCPGREAQYAGECTITAPPGATPTPTPTPGGGSACGGAAAECKCEDNCSDDKQTGESCDKVACTGVMCCPSTGGGGSAPACQPIKSQRQDCSPESFTKCVGSRDADPGKCDPGYACRQFKSGKNGEDENGLPICQCTWNPECNECIKSAPSAVTLVSPTNGGNTNSATVLLDWTGVSSWGLDCDPDVNTSQYRVYTGTTAAAGTLVATVNSSTTSYNFTGNAGQLYYWKVQATNGVMTKTSEVWSFYTSSTIQGNVYLDTDNTCSTATPYSLGGASVSERVTGQSGSVGGSGTYSITNIPQANNAYTIDLNYDTANYICSTGPTGTGCGLGCPTQTLVTASSTGNNFFLTDKRSAWWQVMGAPVYAGSQAGGVTVLSQLPSALDRLILPGLGGTSGALLRGSGSANLGNGSVSDDLWSTVARYRGKTMNYNYFAAQMGVVRGQDSEFVSDTLAKPSYDPDKDFWYSDPVSGVATVDDTWVVPSGESYVIFVNGDLRIPENITVAEGGFLAFIVSGDIIVEASVTGIEGIYLSSGNFETETVYVAGVTDDVQLQVEGNVVAWGALSLTRDLGVENLATPAELFIFRPDLLINMPSKMRSFALQWEEVVAGTFGN